MTQGNTEMTPEDRRARGLPLTDNIDAPLSKEEEALLAANPDLTPDLLRVFSNHVCDVDIRDIFENNPVAGLGEVIYQLENNPRYTLWNRHQLGKFLPWEYVEKRINELKPK